MKTLTLALAVGLAAACAAPAFADSLAPAALSPSAAAVAISPSAQNDSQLYEMKEVRVVAKRSAAERAALLAAVKAALEDLRLKHWTDKPVTESDLMKAVTTEQSLAAFDLGSARIESVTQERADSPDGREGWNCRLVLTLRRK